MRRHVSHFYSSLITVDLTRVRLPHIRATVCLLQIAWVLLCISVYVWPWLFLATAQERHAEAEKTIQRGQKRDRSAVSLSNNYLVALWCDMVGRREPPGQISSHSLSALLPNCAQLMTHDLGCLVETGKKYILSYRSTGEKRRFHFSM